jgi:hypothetical protein
MATQPTDHPILRDPIIPRIGLAQVTDPDSPQGLEASALQDEIQATDRLPGGCEEASGGDPEFGPLSLWMVGASDGAHIVRQIGHFGKLGKTRAPDLPAAFGDDRNRLFPALRCSLSLLL